MNKVFYTSDTHFTHEGVIGFAHRPFANAQSMGDHLINAWNRVVHPQDTVYHLGDFAYDDATKRQVDRLLRRLNGNKFLVVGNHDTLHVAMSGGWVSRRSTRQRSVVHDGMGITIHMTHAPPTLVERARANRRTLFLHGHLHQKHPGQFPLYDVGVDANGFTPVEETVLLDRFMRWEKQRAHALLALEKLRDTQ